MKKKPENDECGFVMVEALIATAIFAIAISAVFYLIAGSFKANDSARGITEQTALAADLIEQLYPLTYDHDDLKNGVYPLPDQGRYSISYTVEQDTLLRNTKKILVTIQWTQNGADKTITIDHIKPDTI